MEPYIIDIIGTIGIDATITTLKEHLAIAAGSNVVINIDSPGGSVFDGIAQYNAIKDYPGKVTAKINALAASAASYLPLAADEVIAHEDSSMMIHNVSSLVWGDHRAMRKEAEGNEALSKILAKLYSVKTGKLKTEISEMMNEETWFYGNDIKKFGIADAIVPVKDKKLKTACLEEGKAKFLIMMNSMDKEKYNEELKRVVNIIDFEKPNANVLDNKNKEGAAKVERSEVISSLQAMKKNNDITLPEIAEALDLSNQVLTNEHAEALNTVNKLNAISEGKKPVAFVESLIEEIKINSVAVREARLTELFGASKDAEGTKNVVREYAEQVLKDQDLTDEKVNELKEGDVYKSICAKNADVNSKANSLGTADDLDNKDDQEESNIVECEY